MVGVENTGRSNDFALARYNTDGSFDSSFSGDGKQTTNFSTSNAKQSDDWGNSVTIEKDGKILVDGRSDDYLSFARYNKDGSLDSTFDNNGTRKSNIGYGITSKIAVQNDGKIVASIGINNRQEIIRFGTDGSLDKTFVTDKTVAYYTIFSVVIQSDGKIVVPVLLISKRVRN